MSNEESLFKIDPEFLKKVLADRRVMAELTRQSFFWFFLIYFSKHITYELAPFHYKMLDIGQDETIKRAGVMTFRNSAKSTILNTAWILWEIMGIHQKKHIVIASQTQQRGKDHLMNIRKAVERYQLLRDNLGPFDEKEDRWHSTTLIITKFEARISVVSSEEVIRGLREGPHRPQIIVADDIEDSNSTKTREGRDKTFNWFTGELLPLGSKDTKVVVLGNFTHEDSALSQIEKLMKEGKMEGIFMRVPLVYPNDKIAWLSQFPDMAAIEKYRLGNGNVFTWNRDYLLKSVPPDWQIVKPEYIKYYKNLPDDRHHLFTMTGVDLASSPDGDFTAMVSAKIYRLEGKIYIYILPNPINKRMPYPETVETAMFLSLTLGNGHHTKMAIEEAGTQAMVTQDFISKGLMAEGFKVGGQDKGSRLQATTHKMFVGEILFPEVGAELLIQQLTGFGIERRDDLCDAFTVLVLTVTRKDMREPKITIFSANNE